MCGRGNLIHHHHHAHAHEKAFTEGQSSLSGKPLALCSLDIRYRMYRLRSYLSVVPSPIADDHVNEVHDGWGK